MIPGEHTDGTGVPREREAAAAPPEEPDPFDTPERRARQDAWRGLDEGSIMSAELLTATLVWFGVGWLLDRLLGTMPWFMFAGALLGNWTGLYLIWLRGQRSEERETARAGRVPPRAPTNAARPIPPAAGRASAGTSAASPASTTPSASRSAAGDAVGRGGGQRPTDDQ